MPIKSPADLAELLKLATDLIRETRRAHNAAVAVGSDATEHISHAYNFAGVDDATANANAARTMKAAIRIGKALEEIGRDLALIATETRKASAAVEEAQARRVQAARSYRV